MIELFTAKSGAPSLKVGGVALHSPYDPVREARRFVAESLGAEPPSAVIVLGECMGHICAAVAEAHPGTLIVSVVYSAEIARAAGAQAERGWDPSHPETLEEFLRLRLDELQVEGLRMIEWPPAARAFPEASLAANEAVRRVVQEMNGSLVTTAAAGRLWFRNCFSNFLHVERVLAGALCQDGRPVVIAAPGPSLEDSAGFLAGARDRTALWALPSSCPFLMDRGLVPDLVIMTDPGFYALHHLQLAAPACPIAMPLSAARGTWELGSHPAVFLLEQPSLVERSLLGAAGLAPPAISPHGTVTATAIELALASTSGPVIVAGLDLGSRHLVSHARPNAFDSLLHLQASRFKPHTAQWFDRDIALGSAEVPGGGGFRSTPALRTYAGWLDTGLRASRERLFRLSPSPVGLSSMAALDGPGLEQLLDPYPARSPAPLPAWAPAYPEAASRRTLALRLLADWMQELTEARGELSRGSIDLGRRPLVLDLARMIAPRRLVDALRRKRRGESAAAQTAAEETLEECAQFLGGVAGKLRG